MSNHKPSLGSANERSSFLAGDALFMLLFRSLLEVHNAILISSAIGCVQQRGGIHIPHNGNGFAVHISVSYVKLYKELKLNHGDLKAPQGDTGHAEIDMITKVYAHIFDLASFKKSFDSN